MDEFDNDDKTNQKDDQKLQLVDTYPEHFSEEDKEYLKQYEEEIEGKSNVTRLKTEKKKSYLEIKNFRFQRACIELNKVYECLDLNLISHDEIVVRNKQTGDIVENLEKLVHYLMDCFNSPILTDFKLYKDDPLHHLPKKEALNYVEMWLSTYTTNAIKIESFIGFDDKRKYLHNYKSLPWNDGFPYWQEILARMSNPEGFCAYIASLFDSNSPRNQYLWLQGRGGDSKGVINDALCQIMGSAGKQISTIEKVNQFFVSSYWLCRLISVQEAKGSLCQSEGFKSLVSDSHQVLERKYHQAKQTRVHFKFILNSNEEPLLRNLAADKRRIIYSSISPYEGNLMNKKVIVGNLIREWPEFIYYCFEKYQELDDGKQILNEGEEITGIIEDQNADYKSLLLQHYYVVDYKRLPRGTKKGARPILREIRDTITNSLGRSVAINTIDWPGFTAYLKSLRDEDRVLTKISTNGKKNCFGGLVCKNGPPNNKALYGKYCIEID